MLNSPRTKHQPLRTVRDLDACLMLSKDYLLAVAESSARIPVSDPEEALSLLDRLCEPMSNDSLSGSERDLVDALIEAGGARRLAGRPQRSRANAQSPSHTRAIAVNVKRIEHCARLVVGVSGGIQSFVLPAALYSSFMRLADTVEVVLTQNARRFVTRHSIEALGIRVWADTFATAQVAVPHMHLSKCDLLVVYPASASVLHRLACGDCSDLLSLVATATEAPVVVVPAMNAAMWRNPAVRRNALHIVRDGRFLVVPTLMHEVSGGVQESPIYGGAGVTSQNLVPALGTVLGVRARSSKPASCGST